jgi:uncharacterized protein YceH (UPF0502 family)
MVDASGVIELTAVEARVLGALLEKQLTTPDAYPLTLKALTAACNQTSSRDPVVSYEPNLVETTLLVLKAKGLARVVHPGSGERATKYRQVADEALRLGSDERALLCVLLLRGAQTVAELKARTERLHAFDSLRAIETVLDALTRRDPALVARVDRLPGQKEDRWIQLLEAGADERAAASVQVRVTPSGRGTGRVEELEDRVGALEMRLSALVEALGDLVDLPESTQPDGRHPDGGGGEGPVRT